MEQLILRQAAIDALRTCYDTETITMDNGDEYINYGDAVGEIEQLPPIQPVNCSEFPNNSDVVDRQKAKNAICNACGKIDCDEMDTCEKLDIPSEGSKLLQPWEVLAAQSVLSQPEIVRCKDCKYAEYIDDVQTLWCTECGQGRTVAPNDFCSYAERREVTT